MFSSFAILALGHVQNWYKISQSSNKGFVKKQRKFMESILSHFLFNRIFMAATFCTFTFFSFFHGVWLSAVFSLYRLNNLSIPCHSWVMTSLCVFLLCGESHRHIWRVNFNDSQVLFSCCWGLLHSIQMCGTITKQPNSAYIGFSHTALIQISMYTLMSFFCLSLNKNWD